MSTTIEFQSHPDYYKSIHDCKNKSKEQVQTNPRYKNFTQSHFTAGDEEQFQRYRDDNNNYENLCYEKISLKNNIFYNSPSFSLYIWSKNKDLEANTVINTFRYIFHKLKKGIFIKIQNNKLRVFLPFSKSNFVNEWSHKIKVDKNKYSDINDFIKYISESLGYTFKKKNVNNNINEWYGNNCLIRYEYPISENDTNIGNIKNMFEVLCSKRKLPDIEFFINRRDFPIITKDETEPYNNIWGTKNMPLVSHNYEKYSPIFSMSSSERYADMLIPTWDDWGRVQSKKDIYFTPSCSKYEENFNIQWENKIPTAVFRGSSTGCGTTIDTNLRLKVSQMSLNTPSDKNGVELIDAGITKWNNRPRKLENEEYLQTIEIDNLNFNLSKPLSPQYQSNYKYIINIDGHVSAFRFSQELNMGSVVLKVKSKWKLWYEQLLEEYVHYIPIKEDLSDLIDVIKWCRKNDSKCKKIAENARDFFNTYLQEDGILDYIQYNLVELKDNMGIYLYNFKSPLSVMLEQEYSSIDYSYPKTYKTINDINIIPNIERNFGLLKGLEWIVRKVIIEGSFLTIATKIGEIFKNKTGVVNHYKLAGFSFAVKTAKDIEKKNEHIHEVYNATKSINELSKLIPNFAYIFGGFIDNDTYNVISEYIEGQTFSEYITSENFNFQEYLFIIIQLCLAVEVAQNNCGFVHYDLTPWNIVLKRLKKPMKFNYVLNYDQIITVKTSVIPVILDYGKSHIIYNQEHHGYINMFKTSKIQDILSILIVSVNQILGKTLDKKEISKVINLSNFISNSNYYKGEFKSIKSINNFFRIQKKYSNLAYSNKYELEEKNPYDLILYIKNNNKDYKFNLGKISKNNYTTSNLDKSNPRQVYDYILSKSINEYIKSYENVFSRVMHCSLPISNNKFFIYYVIQNLENNLLSVGEDLKKFMSENNITTNNNDTVNSYEKTMTFLHNLYRDKLSSMDNNEIEYTEIDFNENKELIQAPYNDETFLNPDKVYTLLKKYTNKDLSEYKDIILSVFLNNGEFKLDESDYNYYMDNFKDILDINSLIMKNNNANVKTLNNLSSKIYKINLEKLQKNNININIEKYLKIINFTS